MSNKRCKYCKSVCIKYGLRNRRQRYRCSECNKIQLATYVKDIREEINLKLLKKLHKVGLGIGGIAEVMEVSKATVQRILEAIAERTNVPEVKETDQEYEVDELRTYIGNKENESWVMYAINRNTRQVIDFVVGRRTKENLKKLVNKILNLKPKKIITDFLNIYPGLIPEEIHKRSSKILSIIERKNLTLRTHLKRLNRKTICYSKNEKMLENSVKIYFFG